MGLKGLVIVLQSLLRYGGLWQGVAPDIVDGGDMLGEESLGSADNIYRPSGMLVFLLLTKAFFAYYHLIFCFDKILDLLERLVLNIETLSFCYSSIFFVINIYLDVLIESKLE